MYRSLLAVPCNGLHAGKRHNDVSMGTQRGLLLATRLLDNGNGSHRGKIEVQANIKRYKSGVLGPAMQLSAGRSRAAEQDIAQRTVLFVQGNCPKPPSPVFVKDITGPPLLPVLPGQCLIVSNAPIMNVRHGNLLLDNLYFRRRPQQNHRDMEAFIVQV
jgi:hypothetical protein